MLSKQERERFVSSLKSGAPQLSVGTLTGDMMNQAGDVSLLEKSDINFLHVDIMDGVIWPAITVGASYVKALNTKMIKDIHLIIDRPEKHVANFAQAGADIVSFALEHSSDIDGALEILAEEENKNDPARPVLRGVSIYPTTNFDEVMNRLDSLDAVTVLSIGPETGKETFFDVVAERVSELRAAKPELLLSIDGGVKLPNVGTLADYGSDLIVTGSAVFDGVDPRGNIQSMRQSIQDAKA